MKRNLPFFLKCHGTPINTANAKPTHATLLSETRTYHEAVKSTMTSLLLEVSMSSFHWLIFSINRTMVNVLLLLLVVVDVVCVLQIENPFFFFEGVPVVWSFFATQWSRRQRARFFYGIHIFFRCTAIAAHFSQWLLFRSGSKKSRGGDGSEKSAWVVFPKAFLSPSSRLASDLSLAGYTTI